MSKPGIMFYFDVRPCIKRLTLEEKGRLFEAILDYAEFGAVPDIDGALGVAWDFIQPKIDRDGERYDKQIEQKQYAAFSREIKKQGKNPISFDDWKALPDCERYRLTSGDTGRYPTNNYQLTTNNNQHTTDNNTSGADKPPVRHKFSPPTVEEVKAYCSETGYDIDPDRFVSYYTSIGWKVGKNPMKDWKAAVRNWSRKEESNERTKKNEFSSLGTIGTVL